VGAPLQRSVLHFTRDNECCVEPGAGGIQATRRVVQEAEAEERMALAASVPDLTGLLQRRLELRVSLGVLPGGRQRAAGDAGHRRGRGRVESRRALHQ